MAYLPGFEYDIFISYARVDDQDGWVDVFQKQLEVGVSRLVGRMDLVRVWRDTREVQGNQIFDQTIQNAIDSSALFIALTSKGYFASPYCRKELRWFREKNAAAMSVGDRLKLFNVLLTNIDYSGWAEEYAGTSGIKFHDAERSDQIGYPSDRNEKPFKLQMRQLCEAVHATLQAFKQAIESAQSQQSAPAAQPETGVGKSDDRVKSDDRPVVFLADVPESLEDRRSLVAADLDAKGVEIIGRIPPPYDLDDHETEVIARISRADMAVHLLDDKVGRRFDDRAPMSYPQLQVELGLQCAKSQLIWVPQPLNQEAVGKIADKTQRDLLDRLENGKRDRTNYRFVRESPSEIANLVIARLEEIRRERERKDLALAALINTHLKDQFHAWEIGKALSENKVQPLINPPVDDPTLSANVLEALLKQASKLIVIFGQVTEDWVRERLGAALNVAATTPDCPLRGLAVCFVPPRRKDDGPRFDLGFAVVHHFDLQEFLDPPTLAEFLKL